MQLDLKTNTLFSDQGVLLKKLSCQKIIEPSGLLANRGNPHHICLHCDRTVYNTTSMNDFEVAELLQINPDACLQVKVNQWNS